MCGCEGVCVGVCVRARERVGEREREREREILKDCWIYQMTLNGSLDPDI